MAKTLVIKGANFITNKIETVTFDRIHTTALSIESTVSLTSIGATHEIEYTITPANSEDPILWTSSDETVCTVDSDGVVTAVGCGTATITATSNSISDTCTVTNNIEIVGYSRAIRTIINPNNSTGHASLCDTYLSTSNTGYDIYMTMVATDSTKTKLNVNYPFAKKNEGETDYHIPETITARVYSQIGYVVPIELPANCSKVTCKALNEHYGAYPIFYKKDVRANDSITNQFYYSAYKEAGPTYSDYSWDFAESKQFNVPSGYDSVAVLWKADTSNGATNFVNLTESQLAEFKIICA